MGSFEYRPDLNRRPGWQILTVAGVPFFVEGSFLLFITVIVLMFIENMGSITQAGLLGFVIFFSLMAHEAGHAMMARLLGVNRVAVSLVMFGGRTTFPPTTRGRSLFITMAGPSASLLLVTAAWFLMRTQAAVGSEAARFVLFYVYALNSFWAIFNLLPIYPMDGGQICFYGLSFFISDRQAMLTTAIVSVLTCAVGGYILYFVAACGFVFHADILSGVRHAKPPDHRPVALAVGGWAKGGQQTMASSSPSSRGSRVYHAALLATFVLLTVWSAVAPFDRFTWWLRNYPLRSLEYPLWPRFIRVSVFTSLIYTLVLIHAAILLVGGPYIPMPACLRSIGSRRRLTWRATTSTGLGHLAQGAIPAMVAREVLVRRARRSNRAGGALLPGHLFRALP